MEEEQYQGVTRSNNNGTDEESDIEEPILKKVNELISKSKIGKAPKHDNINTVKPLTSGPKNKL